MAYTDKSKLRVVYGDYTLGVHGKEFNYIFSYAQGGLESIVKNGYEWLYRCPKPTFWRALTDNDRGNFILRVEAGFQPICLSIVKMFRFLWMVKYKKYMHQIIIVMKEMFQLMRSGFNILMKQSILLLQRLL